MPRSSLRQEGAGPKKNVSAQIGGSSVEEIVQAQSSRALPAISTRHVSVTMLRKADWDMPLVEKSVVYGWQVTCPEKNSNLTVKKIAEALQKAVEEDEAKLRDEWSSNLGKPSDKVMTLMKPGTFKVESVTFGGVDAGAGEEKLLDLPNGEIIVAHATCAEYRTDAGMCSACGCTVQ